ncbi:MAG: radical SAM protein [Desulfatiglandales bacterium]
MPAVQRRILERIAETMQDIAFESSEEQVETPVADLVAEAVDFLGNSAERPLVPPEFIELVGDGNGESRFNRLLEAAGHADDPAGFFESLMGSVVRGKAGDRGPFQINGVEIPGRFVVALLGRTVPGNEFISIRNVDQLEDVADIRVEEGRRDDIQKVLDLYPVRLSRHTARQMMVSRDVAYQYLPFVEELDPAGHVNTWIGQFHQGLLERMYLNRVIFLLNMTCPVYCRFCFRKHKESRNETSPTPDEVREAVAYVDASPTIKEIVITGGDPFLNRKNMEAAIDGLRDVPHVKTLRLATRSISYYPHLFLSNDGAWLSYLKRKNLELEENGKRIEVATHFIHPDEVSPDSLEIISELVRSGIQVYVQTPFLNDCNDQGPELTELFSTLRGAGAEMHYIYIPCSPIHGNSIYWAPLSRGIDVGIYLRGHLSDRAIPRICTATPIGKMDWNNSGWAIGRDPESEHFVWIRSPYTPEYFNAFAPVANELENVRVNDEGTIDVRYMAQIGDDTLFAGSRAPRSPLTRKTDPGLLEAVRAAGGKDQRFARPVVSSGVEGVVRVHKTRVELDIDRWRGGIEYIRSNGHVTDVVAAGKRDGIAGLRSIRDIVKHLRDIPHVNSLRIRSLAFAENPKAYTRSVICELAELNRLTVTRPLRLEIETLFFHSGEFLDDHRRTAALLRRKGISVYVNTPLISGGNDNPEEIQQVAHMCRDTGVEFHHVYVAGHPMQASRNSEHPVDVDDVLDIATWVRRDGSGREIPAYILLTELGEVDFGLSSRLVEREGGLWARLLSYDLAYFQAMDPEYNWPEGVAPEENGRPVVPVPGLVSRTGFMVS